MLGRKKYLLEREGESFGNFSIEKETGRTKVLPISQFCILLFVYFTIIFLPFIM